jgi:hypothetical protein
LALLRFLRFCCNSHTRYLGSPGFAYFFGRLFWFTCRLRGFVDAFVDLKLDVQLIFDGLHDLPRRLKDGQPRLMVGDGNQRRVECVRQCCNLRG